MKMLVGRPGAKEVQGKPSASSGDQYPRTSDCREREKNMKKGDEWDTRPFIGGVMRCVRVYVDQEHVRERK